MARIFISYFSEDLDLPHTVRGWLVEENHEVFLAEDLRDGVEPGEQWRERLYKELQRAGAMVCIVTASYLESSWCSTEVWVAQSRKIPLLPLNAQPDISHPYLEGTQHIDLRDREAARAAVVEAARRWDWPDDRSPFPGLRSFKTDEDRVFFGRDLEVNELVEQLSLFADHGKHQALLITGASGCGKSSLVRAGLVAKIDREPDWRTVPPMQPGADPVGALAQSLAKAAAKINGLDWTVEKVRRQLDDDDDDSGLARLVHKLLPPSAETQHLLLVVDQFEELFTQTDPAQRAKFTTLLNQAPAGTVQVVATLRPEFFDQLLAESNLARLFSERPYVLQPLPGDGLRTVIQRPAERAGITVAEDLVTRLVADTKSGKALPLLAFTLKELAHGVHRGDQLSSERYEDLGRVQGALSRQADAALDEAVRVAGRSRDEVIAGLLRLVTVNEQGRPSLWQVPRNELPDPVGRELEPFVARRLLSTDQADHDRIMISLTHEAFLSAWKPLREAIENEKNKSALRTRRALEQAAEEWEKNGRPRERLWDGAQLAGAITDLDAGNLVGSESTSDRNLSRWLSWWRQPPMTYRVDVSSAARDFLDSSRRRDRFRRGRAITVLSVLLVLALVGAGFAVLQQRAAQEQQRIATARQLISQADAIREADPRTALLLGIAAERIRPGAEARAGLVNTLTSTRYAGTLDNRAGPLNSVAFSRDGHTLAAGGSDGRVVLWDLADPARPRRSLAGQVGSVSSVAFSGDGRTLAAGGSDGRVALWDLADPARSPQSLVGETGSIFSVAFSGDGRTLAAGGSDGRVVLWDLADSARPPHSLAGHTRSVNSVAFSPDGRTVATASDDGTALLWRLTDLVRPQPLRPARTSHTSKMTAVAFSPDGRTLVTASDDGSALLWRLTDLAWPQPLQPALISHTGRITAVAFAPDGGALVTASADGTVIRWDLINRAQPQSRGQPLTGAPGLVESVVFAADGRTVTTTSSDDTVMTRDISDPDRPQLSQSRLGASAVVDFLALAPDGTVMVTPTGSDSVILRDITDQAQPRILGQPLTGHRGLVVSAAFSGDGRTLATGSDDGQVILWDLTDRTKAQPLGQPLAGHRGLVVSVAFSGDGRTLATASDDGQVILWDVTDRAQPRILGQPLTGHAGPVSAVALVPDGRMLATAGSDGTVLLWDLTDLQQLRDHATERACAITAHGLDALEWARYVQGLPYQHTC